MKQQALVILSGGQDSTTCLYWALARFGTPQVSCLSFDYGQRHRIELECARDLAQQAQVRHTILPLDTLAVLGGNALTASTQEPVGQLNPQTHLPNTFVPGRNLIFITLAAAYAYPRRIQHLVSGVAQTDYSGYPDCREPTLQALQNTLQLGMEFPFELHSPLMHLSKKQTVELAVRLNALPALAFTHTCYQGTQPPCGQCPACRLRAKGFAEAGIIDPLLARLGVR